MKPFTNKHSIAAGSPLHQGGSKKPDPSELINSKGQSQQEVMKSRKSNIESFRDKIKDLTFNTQEQVDKANSIDARNVAAYNASNDSIQEVNTRYNKGVKTYNDSINKANKNIDDILNQ
jgi:tRNA U34 5-carboxymethylaminomethyl modifying GTPase MnmE/TrmE